MDPTSPLVLRWRYVPRLIPWLPRFLANSARYRAERNGAAMGALFRHVLPAYGAPIQQVGCADPIEPSGALKLYETDAALRRGASLTLMRDGVRRSHCCAQAPLSDAGPGAG